MFISRVFGNCQLTVFFLSTLICLSGSNCAETSSTLDFDFKNPPIQFKSQPLWHINGEMETKEIQRQLQDARDKSGFSGVAVLPMRNTKPDYLTQDYFDRYGDILETCRSLNMNAIFYDDISFPSGTVGGLIHKRYPEHLLSRLDMLEQEATGPCKVTIDLPDGTHMAAVAMNTQTFERLDMPLSSDGKQVVFDVPPGTWKLMVFTCVRHTQNNQTVDYLDPESVEVFISLTYDEYYKRFPDYFGTTIQMTYFDDVGLRGAKRRNWTPGYNKKFKAKYGYSPTLLYPALWYDIGPDTAAARVALFGFRAELLAEGFPRKVHEWAASHGVKSSGHAMGQYHPQPTFLGGDHILFYKHNDIPMIDSIHYYGHGRPGFKLTSSASSSYDRPLTAVEIYGNYRGHFDTAMLYRSGMELFARGANMFLPHGMWYDPKNVRIKPLISDFNKDIAADLSGYNDWVGRCSVLLRGGRHVADIGVLYPVAAMQAYAKLDAIVDQPKVKGNVHPGLYVPPECDFNKLSDTLTGGVRRDFTFLHPEVLNEKCTLENSLLKLNNNVNYETYKVLIIPGCRVIYWSNLQKIKAFYDAGGKVIATTALPSQSAEFGHDQDVRMAIKHIFGAEAGAIEADKKYSSHSNAKGGTAYYFPAFKSDPMVLGKVLDLANPAADVRFEGIEPTIDPEKGMVSYLHKVKDGRHVYYIANSTDSAIDAKLLLRGELKLQQWNPNDGAIHSVEATVVRDDKTTFTRVPLKIDPLTAVFFVEAKDQ